MKRVMCLMLTIAGLLGAQNSGGLTEGQVEAIQQYRKMWNGMSPAQQKETAQAGGHTPEAYEQMMRGSIRNLLGTATSDAGPAPLRSPDYAKRPNANSLQSLGNATQDLNSLRDTNVGRVSRTGCPPEVAMRITELKAKLGIKRAAAASGASADLADRWHELKPVAPDNASAERERLLDFVLGARSAGATKAGETDAQKLDAELLRLTAACPEVR